MKKVTITGTTREVNGSKNASLLRRDKKVPCVLYGGGQVVHFAVGEAELGKLVFTPEVYRVELVIDGASTMALIHETQFHPTSDKVVHVDFLLLDENKEARVTLALKLTGQSAGVRAGGKLNQVMRKLRVKGLPAVLPEHIEVDVTDLGLGQALRVRDLKLEGLTVLEPASEVVATIKLAKQSKEEAATANAAPGATPAAAPAKK